jgi:hypothetical protein
METIELEVKEVLKLRKPQDVAQDINELETIKSAYRHFLASYESSLQPENTIQVSKNLETVKVNLRALYAELSAIEHAIKAVIAPRVIKPTGLMTNEQEISAIMLFNKDKR